jgi:hypothetical protein
MSITSISAAFSAVYIQAGQTTTPATTPDTPLDAQSATQARPVQQATPPKPSEQTHHHHRHGGGEASGQSSDITQSGTNAATSFLNTLV